MKFTVDESTCDKSVATQRHIRLTYSESHGQRNEKRPLANAFLFQQRFHHAMCEPSFLDYQRIIDIMLGLIWFIAGVIVTIALDKWRYRKARPTTKAALETRLHHCARMLVITTRLLKKSDKELKKAILDFDEHHLVFIFEQTEKLIDVYGHLMPIDVQDGPMRFGEKAGYLADAIFHLKANYDILEELDEWKELKPEITNLISNFDTLVSKLTKRGVLSSEFSDHWNKMKALSINRESLMG